MNSKANVPTFYKHAKVIENFLAFIPFRFGFMLSNISFYTTQTHHLIILKCVQKIISRLLKQFLRLVPVQSFLDFCNLCDKITYTCFFDVATDFSSPDSSVLTVAFAPAEIAFFPFEPPELRCCSDGRSCTTA